jgi:hypothetical protein
MNLVPYSILATLPGPTVQRELILTMLPQMGEGAAVAGGNALDVVVRILNNQLSSLVWIDDKVSRSIDVLVEAEPQPQNHIFRDLHVCKVRRMNFGLSESYARTKSSAHVCRHLGCRRALSL